MKVFLFAFLLFITTYSTSQIQALNVIRIEGKGNASNELEITGQSRASIFSTGLNYIEQPEYEGNKAPILVEIDDLSSLIPGIYQIKLSGIDSLATWKMYLVGVGDTVYSDSVIGVLNRQVIPQWGLAVTVDYWMSSPYFPNPILSEIIYTNNTTPWLTGVGDTDSLMPTNWIRSGLSGLAPDPATYPNPCDDPAIYNDYPGIDDNEEFEMVLNEAWAPYRLVSSGDCSHEPVTEALDATLSMSSMIHMMSVDIILTPDTNKWTRCPVLETQDNPNLSWNGNTQKQDVKLMPSVNKQGIPTSNPGSTSSNPVDANFISGTGMGWFPGYAIDVNTGVRLNMAFGEDSWLANNGGNDMLFNPSSILYNPSPNNNVVFGGKHYVYVFRDAFCSPTSVDQGSMPAYDMGQEFISNWTNVGQRYKIWRSCSWVGMPMLVDGQQWLNSEARIRLRLKTDRRSYRCNIPIPSLQNGGNPMYQVSSVNLGVQHIGNVPALSVYPNPANELINIDIKGYVGSVYVEVYDLSGRLLKTSNSFTLSLKDYQKGVYVLRVNFGGRIEKIKFIKK